MIKSESDMKQAEIKIIICKSEPELLTLTKLLIQSHDNIFKTQLSKIGKGAAVHATV